MTNQLRITPGSLVRTAFILLVLAGTAAAFTSCASVSTAPERGNEKVEIASVLAVPSNRGKNEDSGVVLAYEFRQAASISEAGCRLRLLEMTTRKSYFINVTPGAQAAYTPVPPGRYETGRMGCGLTRVWDLKDILPGIIEVSSGAASYAGKVNLVFNGKTLSEVKKASRVEHASSYSAALSVVPDGMTVVSAYSLTPLTADMASEGASSTGWTVQAQGLATGPVLNALSNDLRKCEMQAGDPLRFGRLDYKASYSAGRFNEFKGQKDVNAFPESFRSCVASTLSNFRPPGKGAVEIQVVY